jgi:hypothetical protein
MCTTIIGIDPDAAFPVLLIAVRDEFLDRPWQAPAAAWPEHPGILGGRDLLAGGTWLAVDPAAPRAAWVLNGHGAPAAGTGRLSRGELPLLAVTGGDLEGLDLPRYDPFHLISATPDRVAMISWDGVDRLDRILTPGRHIVTNRGLNAVEGDGEGFGAEEIQARLDHFQPRLAAVARPEPKGGNVEYSWAPWLPLINGDGLDMRDPRALLIRHEIDGRAAGTSSVSLVALSREGVRYDFTADPGPGALWTQIAAP